MLSSVSGDSAVLQQLQKAQSDLAGWSIHRRRRQAWLVGEASSLPISNGPRGEYTIELCRTRALTESFIGLGGGGSRG